MKAVIVANQKKRILYQKIIQDKDNDVQMQTELALMTQVMNLQVLDSTLVQLVNIDFGIYAVKVIFNHYIYFMCTSDSAVQQANLLVKEWISFCKNPITNLSVTDNFSVFEEQVLKYVVE